MSNYAIAIRHELAVQSGTEYNSGYDISYVSSGSTHTWNDAPAHDVDQSDDWFFSDADEEDDCGACQFF